MARRKKIKLPIHCNLCQYFNTAKKRYKDTGERKCTILKKKITDENLICDKFILSDFIPCKKYNRIKNELCYFKKSHKHTSCKKCIIGNTVKEYINGS